MEWQLEQRVHSVGRYPLCGHDEHCITTRVQAASRWLCWRWAALTPACCSLPSTSSGAAAVWVTACPWSAGWLWSCPWHQLVFDSRVPSRTPCTQPCQDPSYAPLPCCSQVFPDYKERVVRHEAAHFLTGEPCVQSCSVWCRAACQWLWVSYGKRPKTVGCTTATTSSCSVTPPAAGYLLGVPVANYSLTLGKEHTDFAGEGQAWEG